ncbi:magnesium protoporphyrin IX methyltransferase [Paracoccaceae bacterium Fryx2]|nr:magnesium protoporphyrin IX methyltransferase [Paracoccaceae bacterium Fryx2]
MADYSDTIARVEDYFDRTATRTWERLTSDAPVSRIRQTVREGRDRMRDVMLSRLPADLKGARVLDAGCGAGQMTMELAARGADVTAVDISPALIDIAQSRLPAHHAPQVRFAAGDMLCDSHGAFDFVLAMDSLIYYTAPDIGRALERLGGRTAEAVVFTVAPKTPFLMAFWTMGKLFPRSDRSPIMIPHAFEPLAAATGGNLQQVERVSRGFYISECLEYRP